MNRANQTVVNYFKNPTACGRVVMFRAVITAHPSFYEPAYGVAVGGILKKSYHTGHSGVRATIEPKGRVASSDLMRYQHASVVNPNKHYQSRADQSRVSLLKIR